MRICQLPIIIVEGMARKFSSMGMLFLHVLDLSLNYFFVLFQPFTVASGPIDPHIDIYIKA